VVDGAQLSHQDQLVERAVLLDEAGVSAALDRLSRDIAERGSLDDLCLVGIRTGGVHLAERLRERIRVARGVEVPLGVLDITLYRDDAFEGLPRPEVGATHLAFPLTGRRVVLVDDVLYTGRTVRAALDALMEFGRPRRIELCVLVDRGCRELPIQGDHVGLRIDVPRTQSVKVLLREQGTPDRVVVREREG
jgi:pyrimidine operon attenuation protein / uracil phosphoribosyltransferase